MRFKLNPITHFVRFRLHRRIFVYFGMTILFTLGCAVTVLHLAGGGDAGWAREVERVRSFTADRFARVWDDAAARDDLATSIQHDLETSVILRDGGGATLGAYGPSCGPKGLRVPISRDGVALGTVTICAERHALTTTQVLPALFVVGFIVWAASGMLAFRLAWPLGELARVAKDIGEGRTSSRACLGRHGHGEYGLVGQVINEMAARIERQVSEQRELLAAVSHELRTPLARIRLLTEMSRGKGTDDRVLDDLDREVVEIDALVGDLLASSRIDFQVLSLRELDARELATRAIERAGVDATKLVVEATPAEAKVRADATLLSRALSNVIDNAKKHGGGLDVLRVRRTAHGLAFDAEDVGQGFELGEEKRIFEPFYRRGDNGSLGLGLALVKRIAEAHGGRAYAANREGGGARVTIELPAGDG